MAIMIIRRAKKVRTASLADYAWSGLRKFQNIDLVTKRLIDLHKVPAKYHDDVRKQSQQVRYCLIQAREYFAAAKTVSIATKPNLLYYGTMCLALAELLFKQSGESSLDRAREDHRHHGLTMTVGALKRGASLDEAAGAIRARPNNVLGVRRGTFELWHRTSREHPLAGDVTSRQANGGSTTGYQLIFSAQDTPYTPIPDAGITLVESLRSIPYMMEYFDQSELHSTLTRGFTKSEVWPGLEWQAVHRIVFHPSPLFEPLFERLTADPNAIDRIEFFGLEQAGTITLKNDWVNGGFSFPLPPAATISTSEWRMWTNSPPLNEFGYLYVAIYLAGNYARYYPDKWLLDVETSAPLSLAIEELCGICEWRAPWLALCELDQTLYVPEL
ncbi:hypothetical protein ABIF90_001088 [Bradyrhizobium japonicum]